MPSLNREYVTELNRQRHLTSLSTSLVQFDQRLLFGTVLHNQRMERLDSIFHDERTFHAELIGTISQVQPYQNQPQQLAHYIWSRFQASPAHAAIQADTGLRYVSVSCSQRYFIVRLSKHPSKLHIDEQRLYTQWLSDSGSE